MDRLEANQQGLAWIDLQCNLVARPKAIEKGWCRNHGYITVVREMHMKVSGHLRVHEEACKLAVVHLSAKFPRSDGARFLEVCGRQLVARSIHGGGIGF